LRKRDARNRHYIAFLDDCFWSAYCGNGRFNSNLEQTQEVIVGQLPILSPFYLLSLRTCGLHLTAGFRLTGRLRESWGESKIETLMPRLAYPEEV